MGRNSKARRDAKAKIRRRQERAHPAGVGAHEYVHVDQGGPEGAPSTQVRRSPDLSLRPGEPEAAIFRRTCTECGAGDLAWMTAPELLERVEEKQRARVLEGIEMVGNDADAWLCPKCGGFGLFGA